MKRIFEMDSEEIVNQFLLDRGISVDDEKARKEYDRSLVEKAKKGDSKAVIELLKIGHHYLTTALVHQ